MQYNNIPTGLLAGEAHNQRAQMATYQQIARLNQMQAAFPGYGYVPISQAGGMYNPNAGMAALTQDFSNLSVPGNAATFAMVAPAGSGMTSAVAVNPGSTGATSPYVIMRDGNFLVAVTQFATHEPFAASGPLPAVLGSFDPGSYLTTDRINAGRGFQQLPVTPEPRTHVPRVEVSTTESLGITNRKNFQSSFNEREQAASPETPPQTGHGQLDTSVVIARPENSPLVHYDYRTPSPGLMLPYEQAVMNQAARLHGLGLSKDFIKVTDDEIPMAITAVYDARGCRKTLEASLFNATGTTNVYIRGFAPETNDAILFKYASCFGNVATSKAMIDNQTGACKG